MQVSILCVMLQHLHLEHVKSAAREESFVDRTAHVLAINFTHSLNILWCSTLCTVAPFPVIFAFFCSSFISIQAIDVCCLLLVCALLIFGVTSHVKLFFSMKVNARSRPPMANTFYFMEFDLLWAWESQTNATSKSHRCY